MCGFHTLQLHHWNFGLLSGRSILHACRFLRPLLPNRANEVSNKETTIRLQCLTHICAQYTMQEAHKTSQWDWKQLEKMFSFESGPRNDVIRAQLHQTSCTLNIPGLQTVGQTHQESTSPPMAVDYLKVGLGRLWSGRSTALQSLETVEQMQWPTWLIWGIFISSTVSKISSISEAVKQSQRRPQHQFRLWRMKTSFAVRIRKPKWYPAFFICSATR